MIVPDSNVWIALFDEKDTTHARAEELFKQTAEEDVAVTEYVVLEVATLLKKKVGASISQEFLAHVFKKTLTKFLDPPDLFARTIEAFSALSATNLSFVDCSLLVLSREYEVISFDKKLARHLHRSK